MPYKAYTRSKAQQKIISKQHIAKKAKHLEFMHLKKAT